MSCTDWYGQFIELHSRGYSSTCSGIHRCFHFPCLQTLLSTTFTIQGTQRPASPYNAANRPRPKTQSGKRQAPTLRICSTMPYTTQPTPKPPLSPLRQTLVIPGPFEAQQAKTQQAKRHKTTQKTSAMDPFGFLGDIDAALLARQQEYERDHARWYRQSHAAGEPRQPAFLAAAHRRQSHSTNVTDRASLR
jgi:hypothetical protein